MIFPKLLYVTLYSVLGSAIPYLSLFYDEALHLPSNQIGILLAIAPFLQSLACPVWTVVVDRRPSWHGPLMTVLSIIGGLAILTLTLIPGWLVVSPEEEDAAAVPADESSMTTITFLVTASLAFVFAFFGQPVATLVDSAVLKMLGDQKILYGKQRLWGSISNGVNILLVGLWISKAGIQVAFYVFAVGVASFAILALFTRFPPSADEYLEEQQNEWIDEYNEQARLRDPIAISARYGSTSQHQPPMAASSFMTAVSRVLSIGSTSENNHHHQQPYYHHYVEEGIPARRNSTVSHANTEWMEDDEGTTAGRLRLLRTATSVAQDTQMEASQRIANLDHMPSLGLALSNIPTVDTSLAAFADAESKAPPKSSLLAPRVCTFLVTMLLYGISYSMIAQFLFLFLRNDLGIDSALIGWTGPIGGVAEVSTFWISNKLLEEFSVTSLIGLSHLAIIARNLIYTCLSPGDPISVVLALGMQLVNGSAFALAWSTGVSEVDSFFPPDQRAMAQGILAALFTGFGFGFGCLIGGAVYDSYGASALCQTSAGIAAVSLVVFLAGRYTQ